MASEGQAEVGATEGVDHECVDDSSHMAWDVEGQGWLDLGESGYAAAVYIADTDLVGLPVAPALKARLHALAARRGLTGAEVLEQALTAWAYPDPPVDAPTPRSHHAADLLQRIVTHDLWLGPLSTLNVSHRGWSHGVNVSHSGEERTTPELETPRARARRIRAANAGAFDRLAHL